MVRVRLASSVLFAVGAAMTVLGPGCGGDSSRGVTMGRSGGMGGAGTGAGGSGAGGSGLETGAGGSGAGTGGSEAGTEGTTITEGEGGFLDAMGAGPEAIALGGPECGTRRPADCAGIDRSEYYSAHDTFDASPELAACSAYVSFDGCGELLYAFDGDGCAFLVNPGPGGWKTSGHLSMLRECLEAVFTEARFACLASRRFVFYESCYIR